MLSNGSTPKSMIAFGETYTTVLRHLCDTDRSELRRQVNRKRTTCPNIAFDLQPPSVMLNDVFDDREAQPSASFIS